MEELAQWLFQSVVWFAIVASRGSVFLLLLVLTVVIELAAAWIAGVRDWRGEKAVIWVNVLTNPAVVWILVVAGGLPGPLYWTLMGVLEILVVVVEWRLLRWAVGLGSCRAAVSSVAMTFERLRLDDTPPPPRDSGASVEASPDGGASGVEGKAAPSGRVIAIDGSERSGATWRQPWRTTRAVLSVASWKPRSGPSSRGKSRWRFPTPMWSSPTR